MTNLLDVFGTDLTLEKEGVWVEFAEGIKFKIRPMRNKKFIALLQKLQRPYKSAIRNGSIKEDLHQGLITKALAKEVVVDWLGVNDLESGEPLDYSWTNATRLLSDARMERLLLMVVEVAGEQETFKNIEEEETEKNSEKSSSGNSNGKKSAKS